MGSCSRVLTSSYSKGFGLIGTYLGEDHGANQANCIYGIFFYSVMLLASFLSYKFVASVQMVMSLAAVGMSCYLAYILYFILHDLCVVCVSTYAVNILLVFTTWCKRCSIASLEKTEDQYGYTIPNYHNTKREGRDGFKKFI